MAAPSNVSAPQTQTSDEGPVAFDVLATEVVEQPPALADQHQQAAPAVVVVLVLTEMLSELVDPLGEQRDLDLGRSRVAVVVSVLGHDFLGGLHCA